MELMERKRCLDNSISPQLQEEFDLTVQLADQLLNYVSATVYIDIEHESLTTPPGVLLQLNGIQYSFTDRFYFQVLNSFCCSCYNYPLHMEGFNLQEPLWLIVCSSIAGYI